MYAWWTCGVWLPQELLFPPWLWLLGLGSVGGQHQLSWGHAYNCQEITHFLAFPGRATASIRCLVKLRVAHAPHALVYILISKRIIHGEKVLKLAPNQHTLQLDVRNRFCLSHSGFLYTRDTQNYYLKSK